MQKILGLTGSIAGIVGALLCLVAGLARVGGTYYLAGYETTTLFEVGAGLMIFACLTRLEEMRSRQA
jgi:hypothetical protein